MSILNFVPAINDQSEFTGGILADILNEDKQLEMITCIVANPPPTIVFHFSFFINYTSLNQFLLFFRFIDKK